MWHSQCRAWHKPCGTPWHHGSDTALAGTWDGYRAMSMGSQGSREKGQEKGERGKSREQWKQGVTGTKWIPPSPQSLGTSWPDACWKSLLSLWGMGTLTPLGPLPAPFFSAFL